jgi:hypothetical protein
VYIDVTCDDKLEKLIITGNPPREILEETKAKLMQEFSSLTGGGEMKEFTATARDFFQKRNTVMGIEVCIHLIASGKYGEAVEFLNRARIACTEPENEEQAARLITRLNGELKNRSGKLKEAADRYEKLQKKGEKPTRQYYNRLLVMLSTSETVKIQLDRNRLTLSEFAEYINAFNEYQTQLKAIQNGRKHNR